MSERLRAFIAIPIGGRAHEALVDTQRKLRRVAEEKRLGLRWVRAEQLHLTMKFLGDIERRQTPAFVDVVRSAAGSVAPLELSFGAVDVLGPKRRPRVLHAPIVDGSGALAGLAAAIEAGVEPLGIPQENRPFRPHVTLARFKHRGDAGPLLAPRHLASVAVRLDTLTFYESKLGPRGSEHFVVAEAALGPG